MTVNNNEKNKKNGALHHISQTLMFLRVILVFYVLSTVSVYSFI